MTTQADDHFALRHGIRCAGVHLLIEMFGVKPGLVNDRKEVESTLEDATKAAHATMLHMFVHPFKGGGVSGVAVLAESHITFHYWEEHEYMAADVFLCGNTDPDAAVNELRHYFKPSWHCVDERLRGTPEQFLLARQAITGQKLVATG